MTIPNPDGFNNEELMHTVRTSYLNPLISKVEKNIGPRLDRMEPDVDRSFKDVTFDETLNTLTFDRGSAGESKEIDLSAMIPSPPPPVDPTITIVDVSNGAEVPYNNINTIKFNGNLEVAANYPDANGPGYVRVSAPGPWAKLGTGTLTPVNTFNVLDPNNKSKIDSKTLTIVIPEDKTKLNTKVGSGDYTYVEKLAVTGNLGSTSIVDGVLTLNLPDGGSGGGGSGTGEGFFQGFYDNLGEVESQVKNPTSGKTFVFVKDQTVERGQYYDSYFYVNGSWTEVPTDPAVTYEDQTSTTNQGVFSIKPDPRIRIDSRGQLDLSGLATEESRLNFHGFYETQEQLSAAVPTPIVDKSFGYIKHTNGAWIGKVYKHTARGNDWQVMAPIGAISLMDNSSGTTSPAPVYGIAKNDDWEMNSNGIISLKAKNSELQVGISDPSGTTESGTFKSLEFAKGKSFVSLDSSTKKLTIQNPQRVITYNSTFETNHNSRDYEGSIYYDETSRCWMGWGVPEASGGVDKKWTRIAHPKMSEEVKDLLNRLPRKAPYVTPGVLGDAPVWEYTGWTYVKKDDLQLPEAFRERCGAYFITVIQDVENDSPRPQERYQICYADEAGATSYVRRWKRTDTSGEYGWQPWIKISMSAKDISDHNTDHTSHRDSFKFYKVGTLDMSWATLKTKNWVIGDSDLLLLADSDGVSADGEATITTPYTGSYRFSGRIDFDGWGTTKPYQKPQLFIYVYKTVGSSSSIIAEFSYNHTDQNKAPPPLQWKSGEIQLNEGDKIHFEIKAFNVTMETSYPELRFIPNRTFFVMEDFRTTAGSRIAETFRRTIGSLNAHYNVGVNVHYASGTSGTVRVYGSDLIAKATDMSKIKG